MLYESMTNEAELSSCWDGRPQNVAQVKFSLSSVCTSLDAFFLSYLWEYHHESYIAEN